jgi:uncharacterized membrane protein YdjX (TVP38/TMEM64 family)
MDPVAPSSPPPRPPAGVYGAGALLLLWMGLPAVLGVYLLTQIAPLTEWLGQDRLQGAAIFALGYAVCCGSGVLPTYAPSIVGGWIFGPWLGFPACVVGYLGGSSLGFLISRLAAGRGVEQWIDRNPRSAVIRRALVQERPARTLLIVGLLRLSPSAPFAATNLVMASSGVPYRVFITGTVLGMAPRTFIATLVSHAAASTGAKDLVALATEQGFTAVVIGAVLLVGSLAVIAHVARRALQQALAAHQIPDR